MFQGSAHRLQASGMEQLEVQGVEPKALRSLSPASDDDRGGALSVYLDVETDWHGRLTIIGFYHRETGLVQLVGGEISKGNLLASLPPAEFLFTYNGHCFDLRCIRRQLGVELRDLYRSCDLRWICQRHGITGGLKVVERRLGITRALPGLDGSDAVRLWARFLRGDREALQTLLLYNREDVLNLVRLRECLENAGIPLLAH